MKIRQQAFRRSVRNAQIESYMTERRRILLQNEQRQCQLDEISEQLSRCIDEQDLEKLFQRWQRTEQHLIGKIGQQLVERLYIWLEGEFKHSQTITILRSIIQRHPSVTLFNPKHQQLSRSILQKAYQMMDSLVYEARQNRLNLNNPAISCSVDNLLCIIRMPFLRRYNVAVSKLPLLFPLSYITKYVFKWSRQLCYNSAYLGILEIVLNEESLREHLAGDMGELHDEKLLNGVICNVLEGEKVLAGMSLAVLDRMVREIGRAGKEETVLRMGRVLPKVVRQVCEVACRDSFNLRGCSELIQSWQDFIISAEDRLIVLKMGEEIQESGVLMSLIELINQTRMPALSIYCLFDTLLRYLVQFCPPSTAMELITKDMRQNMIQALKSSEKQCKMPLLNIIRQLVTLCEGQGILEEMYENGIPLLLEELQFDSQLEVSQCAAWLLEGPFQEQRLQYDAL